MLAFEGQRVQEKSLFFQPLFHASYQEGNVENCGAEICRYLRERSKHISWQGFIAFDTYPLEVKAGCQVKHSGELPPQQFALRTQTQ